MSGVSEMLDEIPGRSADRLCWVGWRDATHPRGRLGGGFLA
jgi:hypothetical protein